MPPTPPARLCCLDLDTFFVSVERLLDPTLIGKPVVVGGLHGRGVVTSCSYEVRALGVRSGMPAGEARRLAPNAVFVANRPHGLYGEYAGRVKAILDRHCPAVQTASIDEFFLDFAGCESLFHQPGDADGDATIARVVREMRVAIQVETGLPASAGVGTTRPIAKMASSRAKPAGVFVVAAGAEDAFVRDLPVRRFPGIGPAAEIRLRDAGLTHLGQLLDLRGVERAPFARLADAVQRAVHPDRATELGADRPAFQEHDPDGHAGGSLSNERTFREDVSDFRSIADQLRALAERTCWRARKRGVRAKTITLKLRYSDFDTITRARTLPPTDEEAVVYACVLELFHDARTRRLPVRLLGVALSGLVGPEPQVELPFPRPARPRVGVAIDAVRERFGYDAIRLGAVPRRRDAP